MRQFTMKEICEQLGYIANRILTQKTTLHDVNTLMGIRSWLQKEHLHSDDLHSIASILGKKGGQSRSTAKITASRENGKRGGRSRKDEQ